MRIAIDARELTGRPTGVGRYLRELLLAWGRSPAARAHQFVLISTQPVDPPSAEHALTCDTIVEGGQGTVWEQTMLPRLIRESRADVFFAPGYTAPLLCPAPSVLAVHDVSFAAHPEWFSWREGTRRRLLTRWSARRAARVLTISSFSKREIVRHLGVAPENVEVTYLGVTGFGPTRSAEPEARSQMVLYVGSIFERRHIPELIAGFAVMAPRVPGARLEIVGDNRTQPPVDIAALAASAGVGSQVRARDYVSDAELAALYANASAFAFLSGYEGFGLTPLEALAAGAPPVVLDTDVGREIYGEGAIYVASPNPSLIATALEAAIVDSVDRRRVLAAAPQVLSRYSWDDCAHRTLDVLVASA